MKWANLRSSLRFRLLAGTLFWISTTIALAGWGLSGLFQQHVATQFHAELATELDQLTAQLTQDAQGQAQLTLALSDPRLSRPYSGYYWQIDQLGDAPAGAVPAPGQLRSRSLWDHVLVLPADTPADGETHQHRILGPQAQWLGVVERSVRLEDSGVGPPRAFRLIAAANERFMAEPVARFNSMLWLALGVLALGLMLAAVVQVVVGLAPLRALRDALGKLRNAETQRLDGVFPVELTPLVDDFNKVLLQNAEVVARARTHAGNLAHALKTPLSVLANAAHATEQKHTPANELAQLVVEQIGLARQQVDYHLARARVAATVRHPGASTPLQPVVEGLVRVMRRVYAERQLEITVKPIAETLCFRGETQDLQEMLGNLLDNACKWATHSVVLTAHVDAASLHLTLDDDGPGIAAEQRDAVMRRGVRADEQVAGSGLGLAIVGDLTGLYGGRVELGESPLGGLRVVLVLPVTGVSA
jgi:signal transduction histidine kinase